MSGALVQQIRNLPTQVAQEVAVSAYLEQARDRLAEALEATGPQAVANLKAEIATAAEATKQLGLSKEIRDDATEMVRRAEYALGKAIRKGQAEGAVRKTGDRTYRYDQTGLPRGGVDRSNRVEISSVPSASPDDFVSGDQERADIYAMSGDVAEGDFEEALGEAREEGNLSRANVVRKIRQQASPQTRDQRAEKIRDLAYEGLSSADIAKRMDMSREGIKKIATDYDIDIQADRVRGKRARIDSNKILANVAGSLEAAVFSLRQINVADLDQEEAQTWIDSLIDSQKTLAREVKKIKESLS